MNINTSNYESWFLDYHEGTLSAENSAELFLFLEQHPELKEEFESFEMMMLPAADPTDLFPDKISLKKNNLPDATTIQDWLIAEMEGDLNLQQRAALLSFLEASPEYQKDRALYAKTKIEANASIQFPNKSKLRKPVIGASVENRWYYAVAASLILLIGAWFVINSMHPKVSTETAEITKDSTTQIDSILPESFAPVAEKQIANQVDPTPVLPNNKSVVPASEKQYPSTTQKLANQVSPVVKNQILPTEKIKSAPVNHLPLENKLALQNTATPQQLDLIVPRITPMLDESEPFVFAERRLIHSINDPIVTKPENNLANMQPATLMNELKEKAANKVNHTTGEDLLAANGETPKLPAGSRLIKFAAWTITKVSDDRIKVKTAFDPNDGKLAAYEFAIGKSKWTRSTAF
ncbi:hypothetical protein BH11BAC2_BH11BAC2_04100 [soil metagenome]